MEAVAVAVVCVVTVSESRQWLASGGRAVAEHTLLVQADRLCPGGACANNDTVGPLTPSALSD